jgi:hypothetical protein
MVTAAFGALGREVADMASRSIEQLLLYKTFDVRQTQRDCILTFEALSKRDLRR